MKHGQAKMTQNLMNKSLNMGCGFVISLSVQAYVFVCACKCLCMCYVLLLTCEHEKCERVFPRVSYKSMYEFTNCSATSNLSCYHRTQTQH